MSLRIAVSRPARVLRTRTSYLWCRWTASRLSRQRTGPVRVGTGWYGKVACEMREKTHLDNLFLVGMMAAGKTTLGRLLANSLGREFLDSDLEIERRTGADVSWIFDVEGEDGFRDREHKVLDELTRRSGVVLATGGGAVLREANRDNLRARGTVVYIKAGVDQIVERTRRDRGRPLLQGGDLRARVTTLVREREHLYRATAHIVCCTRGRSSKMLAEEILETLTSSSPQPS